MNFTEYYQTFFTRIYNYARFRTNSDSEAEDLTAHIFTKLYLQFEKFDSERASLEVWSFMIARSVTTDFLRKKKIRSWLLFFAQEDLPQVVQKENGSLEMQDRVEQLKQALKKLTDNERELVNLHYYQGLTQRQIAAITGLTPTNIGVRLHRAVMKLKQQIGDIA